MWIKLSLCAIHLKKTISTLDFLLKQLSELIIQVSIDQLRKKETEI